MFDVRTKFPMNFNVIVFDFLDNYKIKKIDANYIKRVWRNVLYLEIQRLLDGHLAYLLTIWKLFQEFLHRPGLKFSVLMQAYLYFHSLNFEILWGTLN